MSRRSGQIWLHVPFERINKKTGEPMSTLEITIEKKTMVNLVNAYAFSVKVRLFHWVVLLHMLTVHSLRSICFVASLGSTMRISTLPLLDTHAGDCNGRRHAPGVESIHDGR